MTLRSTDRSRMLSRVWRTHVRSDSCAAIDAKIGLAGSFTIDPLADYLGAILVEHGFQNPKVECANYNQLVATCLSPASEFETSGLETIVLLWRIEDLSNSLDSSIIASAVDQLLSAFVALRQNFSGTIIISSPPRPRPSTEGLTGFSKPSPLVTVWYSALSRLAELTSNLPNVYTIDMEAEVALLGEESSFDHRKEMLYRQPYTELYHVGLAERVYRVFRARRSEPKKCIVVDCDNTLWGGIVGEDGVSGVELSDDFPGRPYREFQRQLKALRDSGIFLALCSKNNPVDVEEMFQKHSGMVLSLDDISSFKVNWSSKSENIKEIARDLNIGIDAIVFIDDNPFEVDEVGTNAPGVTCLLVPEDVAELPSFFRGAGGNFDRLEITADDSARTDMMRHELTRRDLSQKLAPEEFLSTLELRARIFRPKDADLARVTQLVNKTNQFNVTTRRYSFEEISGILHDATKDIFCVSVSDRFGEYGLVGVFTLHHTGGTSELDLLLMSCRVLGRGIETAMISAAIDVSKRRGSFELKGVYKPTKKNAMVEDLFANHGFDPCGGSSEEVVSFKRSLSEYPTPSYLSVQFDGT